MPKRNLPDDLLTRILSLLPTKRAASTSLLSKRWRNLFRLMNRLCASHHHLYLDDSDLVYPGEGKREREDVQESFGCDSLQKFSLQCQGDLHPMGRTSRWISKAVKRGVSDLDIHIKTPLIENPFHNPYNPPDLVPLVVQHLKNYTYIDNEEGRFDIPSGPHYLCHHNIKKLTVRYNDDVDAARFLSFYAPNLIYLDYSDYLTCEYRCTSFFNTLLEAHIDLAFRRGNGWNCSEIINYICNVQTLYLSSSTVEVMYACLDYWRNHDGFPFFKNLATLHFKSNRREYWKLLSNMIENSPKLETLVLKSFCCMGNCGVIIGGNVVKVLEIQGYKGRRRELNQVKCFLREMEFLEEMKVNISDEIENKLQLTNELLALPKRSSNCHIYVL